MLLCVGCKRRKSFSSLSFSFSSMVHNSTSKRPSLLPLPSDYLSLTKTRFNSWYPSFRKVSQKATILDLVELTPQQDRHGFLDWYQSDGIILPIGSDTSTSVTSQLGNGNSEDSQGEEDDDQEKGWTFQLLDQQIRQVIQKYDGAVFPKLDWSAPRDAAFLLPGNNLRCVLPSDVYLLLKGSDFVSKDIEQVKELEWNLNSQPQLKSNTSDSHTSPYTPTKTTSIDKANLDPTEPQALNLHLILKPHLNIQTSNEFRCFVRSNQLIAISQRDSVYFNHLNEGDENGDLRWKIKKMISDFWSKEMDGREELEKMRKKWRIETGLDEKRIDGDGNETRKSSEGGKVGLTSYVFDIYLTRDYGKVFIMDINPWLERTDPLLWEWEELEELAKKNLEKIWKLDREGRTFQSIRIPIGKPSSVSDDKVEGDLLEKGGNEIQDEDESEDLEFDEDQDEDEDGLPLPVLRLVTNPNNQPNPIHSEKNGSLKSKDDQNTSNPTVFPTQSTPTYSNNMVPSDFMEATAGMSLVEAAEKWERKLRDAGLGKGDAGEESESESEEEEVR